MRPATDETTLSLLAQAALDRGDAEAALAHGRALEALAAQRPRPGIASVALWYAEQGLRVFPLRPGGKQPLPGSRGCLEATSDPDRIRAWWAATPEANLGLATGHLVDVIDIDGPTGVQSWAEAETLPPVLGTVSTPRAGGSHLYIAADPRRTNGANVLPGVDIRAKGGYVVAPPSVGPAGVVYHWRRPLGLADLVELAAAA